MRVYRLLNLGESRTNVPGIDTYTADSVLSEMVATFKKMNPHGHHVVDEASPRYFPLVEPDDVTAASPAPQAKTSFERVRDDDDNE